MRFTNFLIRFLRNSTAVVALEFSLVLPVLLVLFLSMVDITNMIYTKQKISNTAEMFQKFIARPRFDTGSGGGSQMLKKVEDNLIPKLTSIANSYPNFKMGFAVYILDAGNVIPSIALKTDPDPDDPGDPFDSLTVHDDKRTLYVAYRTIFGNVALMSNPRLSYTRTGTAGSAIDEAYFDKNKLDDTDTIYKDLGGKNDRDLQGRYILDTLKGDQYIVVETKAEYSPIFSANKYTGLASLIKLHIETEPKLIENRFRRLLDGGSMH